MCFENSGDLKIEGNWDRPEYKVPYFMIVECKPSTEKVCAPPLEIQEFIRTSTIKAAMQKSVPLESQYEKNA